MTMNALSWRRLAGVVGSTLAGWTVFALFNSSEAWRFLVATGGTERVSNILRYQFSSALLWAVFTPVIVAVAERFPLRSSVRARNAAVLLLASVALSASRALVGGAVYEWSVGDSVTWGFLMYSLQIRFVRNVFIIAVIIVVTEIVSAARGDAEREHRAAALVAEVATAELARARAKLQPRFILTVLESLTDRIESRPRGTDTLLVMYGDLLRQMLGTDTRNDMTLGQALELVEPYLAFERARTAGRFTTRTSLRAELLGARVPALLLHPLIEDVLIRSSAAELSHLEVRAEAVRGHLLLDVEERHASAPPHHDALHEVRTRLERTFGSDVAVEIRATATGIRTALRMPYYGAAGDAE